MTLWSGRFDTAPDPAAFDFGISFGFDRALFEDDVTGSIAWAEALGAAGVLVDRGRARHRRRRSKPSSRRDGAIRRGSPAPTKTCTASSSASWSSAIGDAGRRLHTGRSRNEQVSLDLRLYLRRRIPLLQQALVKLVAACADQAEHGRRRR